MSVMCRLYREGELAEDGFDPSRVSDYLQEQGSLVWLDLEDPTEDELRLIQDEFALHPLAIEDTLHRNQRPKVETYKDHFFLVIHAFRFEGDELIDSEIHSFVGPGFLVTLRYAPAFDLAPVKRKWEKQSALTGEGGGALLYALLDEVVDDCFEVIERLDDKAEGIEEDVFAEEPPPDIQERIFRLKKMVLHLRKRVVPMRDVLDLLSEEGGVVTERLRPYYRDVTDHVIRVMEFSDHIRELLTTALEAHLSQVSNRLNQVMKQLSSWAAIILVPTLIAGIYGMNFLHMPELNWVIGYPLALAMMAVSAFVLFRVFRRRGWI